MTDGWRLDSMTNDRARTIATWTYDEPYSLYNSSPDDVDWLVNPENGYSAVLDTDGDVVAFCCFGFDARVPGGDYDEPAVDFGTGMRPDLTGGGRGSSFIELVLAHAAEHRPDEPLRTTIAAFNERAQHLVRKYGFRETQIFRNPAGREFVIFVRD